MGMGVRDWLNQWIQRSPGSTESRAENNGAAPITKTRIRIGSCTSIGNIRDNNEDRFFVDENRMLYIVADGMGGQAAGEQASQIAVDLIPQQLRRIPINVENNNEIRQNLADALLAANEAIRARGVDDPSTQNMGTTVVVSMIRGARLYTAHIGDSRAYHFRNGKILGVTVDHNLAEALRKANTISKEEVKTHRFRHVLYKYLGSPEPWEGPEMNGWDLQPGDRIVLATDGVTGTMEDEHIRDEIYKYSDPQECASRLVRAALDAGSRDNVTVLVVFVD